MANVPFNVFQRVVRAWDQTYPYNAAQMLRLDARRAGPVERWQSTWETALRSMGLGRVVVEGRRYRHEPPARPPQVRLIPASLQLDEQIALELNTPFAGDEPLRPFIRATADSLDVAVVYQHWIADSVSIRMLLRRWFELAMGLIREADAPPVRIASGDYWQHFGPARVPWSLDRGIFDLFRSFSRFRGVQRVRSAGTCDYSEAFLLHTAPRGLAPALRAAARERGATVNDLFMAAAIEQCARYLPFRLTPSRRRIALGSIVNLRPLDEMRLRERFGLFLGFTSVTVRPEWLADFEGMLRRISQQSRAARRNHAAAAGMLWLYVSALTARFLPTRKTYHFYRKHMPLAGGISNVNLTSTWAAAHHPHLIRQYIRISPTGPMIPVTFTPTTLGDDLHLALTWRNALLTRPQAEAMAQGFLKRLIDFAGAQARRC